MVSIPDFFGRRARSRVQAGALNDAAENSAEFEMAAALVFGLQRRNMALRFVEHSDRVAGLVHQLARELLLNDSEHADLHAAAQLHEIGMMCVPAPLLESTSVFDAQALQAVRAHAAIGAVILAATQTPRTCRLVRHQYTDFDEIRLRYTGDSREILLAGILRAADVLDAMLHPRPYQAGLDPGVGLRVLQAGEGTRFHPQVVHLLLRTGAA